MKKRRLDRIEKAVELILGRINLIMSALDDLKTEVTRNTDLEQSAIILLNGLKQKLDEAGTDPAELKAIRDSLASSADSLAAAIVANTPAASGASDPGATQSSSGN